MLIIAEIKTDDGKLLGVMTLPPKEFKTGSAWLTLILPPANLPPQSSAVQTRRCDCARNWRACSRPSY